MDVKLARQVKPHFVHQLCFYSELLAGMQGGIPKYAHVILGDGTSEPVELGRYAALHRHVITQLEAVVSSPPQVTYPEPVAHCDLCDLSAECRQRLLDDDHLSLVATARRENREDLVREGISTVVALADASAADAKDSARSRAVRIPTPPGRSSGRVPNHRRADSPQPAAGRRVGLCTPPEPSAGDVYFDLEGDPYVGEKGIEYLWGWWTADGYEHRWAHDVASERLALEQFVDRVTRATRDPSGDAYFPLRATRAGQAALAGATYATREVEVDALLRGEVLVDLFAVVRQGLQIGEEKYSLKALERQHDFVRLEHGVREGGGSIVVYEQWLQTGEPGLLESIRAYNEEDCRSTESLRGMAAKGRCDRRRKPSTSVKFSELVPEEKEERGPPEWMDDVLGLIARLAEPRAGDAADPGAPADRELLGNLLLYHYRESKPDWWRYFDLQGKPLMDLVEDRDAVAELDPPRRHPADPVQTVARLHLYVPRPGVSPQEGRRGGPDDGGEVQRRGGRHRSDHPPPWEERTATCARGPRARLTDRHQGPAPSTDRSRPASPERRSLNVRRRPGASARISSTDFGAVRARMSSR